MGWRFVGARDLGDDKIRLRILCAEVATLGRRNTGSGSDIVRVGAVRAHFQG